MLGVPRCQELQYSLPFFQYHPLSSIKFRLPVKLDWIGLDIGAFPHCFATKFAGGRWGVLLENRVCIYWQKQDTGVIYTVYTNSFRLLIDWQCWSKATNGGLRVFSTNPVFRGTSWNLKMPSTQAVGIPRQSHVGLSLGWTSSQTQKEIMLESTQVAHFRLWSLNLKSHFTDL